MSCSHCLGRILREAGRLPQIGGDNTPPQEPPTPAPLKGKD